MTFLLAKRLPSLRAVPIQWDDLPPLYADLRIITAHELLAGTVPDVSEHRVIRHLVVAGDVVWDVGAYMGYYSLLFSHLVGENGKVCSFEPNRKMVPSLTRTLGALGNATVYPFGLADVSRDANLTVPGDPSMASLMDWTGGVVGKTYSMPCQLRRVDDLVAARTIPRPDFIKCDVEGAELLVFQGGRNALDRIDAPFVLFEANVNSARAFGESVSGAMEFLAHLSQPHYRFFEILDEGTVMRIRRPNPMHSNILAVPECRLSRYPELAAADSLVFGA